eukprot:1150372-Pelagomonas_calceolata.AAC.3
MRLLVLSPISWIFLCVAGTVEQAEQPNYLAEGQIPLYYSSNLVMRQGLQGKKRPQSRRLTANLFIHTHE